MPERPIFPARAALSRLRRPHPPAPHSNDVAGSELDAGPARSGLVDSAVYCGGTRQTDAHSLAETFEVLRERADGMAWIGLYRPDANELKSLAAEFDLHELAVEDAITAHQRPKLERYGQTLFVVLRAARYLDDVEEVEFGELHVFVGKNFVVTVRHAESPDLAVVRRRLENEPGLLALGTEAVLYAIMDAVVDGYGPVVAGLENDIDEIETQVFGGDPSVSRRIYELSQEVLDFQRAAAPLGQMLESLAAGFDKYDVDEELRRSLRDVADHVTQVTERVDQFRTQLRDILTVNSILVAQRQNEEMTLLSRTSNAQNDEVKKISAWAAILFAPTLVGTIYGMNFQHMPELKWVFGYPFAVFLMLMVSVVLYFVFKRRGWI
jgi:magnesium transporter